MLPGESDPLLRPAQSWIVSDPTARNCWRLVVQGIELKWLENEELEELLSALKNHEEFGIEELLFAYSGDELTVSFLDDRATCLPDALVSELSSFLAATRQP